MLRIPPAFSTALLPEKDIGEGDPLPPSTEIAPEVPENQVDQNGDDRVDRRQIPSSYRLEPPDEFQFPPQRVSEPISVTSQIEVDTPISEPEMEDLSDAPSHLPELSDTLVNLPPAECHDEEERSLAEQIGFPTSAESDKWDGWDDYPLHDGPPGDERPPISFPLFSSKHKMKEKGEYTKKKQKGATDTTESELEVEEDPLGLVQPSDQQDDDYRPYRAVTRERIANRRGRARWFEPTCNHLTTPDQNLPRDQIEETRIKT